MAILTFPNGQKVNVEFDEVAHSYVVAHQLHGGQWSDFRPTHGITAPLSVVPKEFLKPWASKVGVNAALKFMGENPGVDVPQFFYDLEAYEQKLRTEDDKPVMSYYRFKKQYPWYSGLKAAYKDKAKESAEIGTWLHESIEHYYTDGALPIVTESVQAMWDSFLAFDQFFHPQPDKDGLEFIVYSLNFGYSGQGDFRGRMSGKSCILDWKTTNRSFVNEDGMSVDYFFQLGGLAQAEYERTGTWVDDLGIVNIDKKGGEPRIVWASEFGMSPQDAARAYISCFNTYHMINFWDYKWRKK